MDDHAPLLVNDAEEEDDDEDADDEVADDDEEGEEDEGEEDEGEVVDIDAPARGGDALLEGRGMLERARNRIVNWLDAGNPLGLPVRVPF